MKSILYTFTKNIIDDVCDLFLFNNNLTREEESPPLDIWAVMSTPVRFLTTPGTLVIMVNTSPVNLAAPISPEPSETIEIFLA